LRRKVLDSRIRVGGVLMGMPRLMAPVLVVAVGLAPAAQAGQAAQVGSAPAQAQSPQQQEQTAPNVPTPDQLGVSFERIKRELRETPPSPKKSSVLHLEFHVEVYGKAPKIDLLANVDLRPDGAVRYGGMTHREFLDVVTPQAFKSPPADLLSLFTLAIQQLIKKNDDKK
jgi:hypothetical protein